ncbi:leucine-rich repeat-containing protein 74A-like [Ptychodera flava]|uniref:leucine-rich repeat-containing protein 74A-like n=1 Tax=Ptychodera flava TaxID=63121 RepID=UPI003969DBBD
MSRSEVDNDIDIKVIDLENGDDLLNGVPRPRRPDCKELPMCFTAYLDACHDLGVVPCRKFLQCLKNKEERINLKHYGLGPIGAQAVAMAMMKNVSATYLNLEDNDIGPCGAMYIIEMLTENVGIQRLNLSENNLGSEGARLICDVINSNNNLTNLQLRGNRFKESDAVHFAELLKSPVSRNLKEINLSHNQFSVKGGQLLASAIEINSTLMKLDLSWNHLRRKGSLALCRALKLNTSVTYIDLSWNGLADEGAAVLSVVLRKNPTLRYLDIGCNRISRVGIGKITDALKSNQTLQILKLAGNTITHSGAVAILVTLDNNGESALVLLDLGNVSVTREFLDHLEELQLERPKLKVIHGSVVRECNLDHRIIKFKGHASTNAAKALTDYVVQNQLRSGDLFHRFDKNKDGRLTKSELRQGLREIDLALNAEERRSLYNGFDKDNKGYFDYSDFVSTVQQLVNEERRRRVRIALRTAIVATRLMKKRPTITTAVDPRNDDDDDSNSETSSNDTDST